MSDAPPVIRLSRTRPSGKCSNQRRSKEKREEICNQIGCNVYGRLRYIARVVDWNKSDRDVEVRRELLGLLKYFPRRKRK